MLLFVCRITSTDSLNLVSDTRRLCLLLAESVHNLDVPNTPSYVQVTLSLARLTLHSGRLYIVVLMYAHLGSPFSRKLMPMDTGLPHPLEPIGISPNISRSKVPTERFLQPQR